MPRLSRHKAEPFSGPGPSACEQRAGFFFEAVMPVYPSITIPAQADGQVYALNMTIPAAEGDLYNALPVGDVNQPDLDPRPVIYGAACLAIVQLWTTGSIPSNSTYVVLQTDMGDNVWVDVAWLTWSGTAPAASPAIFALSGGVSGSNSFQQRVTGNQPVPNLGANQITLGGRVRFVGKSTIGSGSSSSSSSSGTIVAQALCTIRYKLLGLR
jgi:hypothetical protein